MEAHVFISYSSKEMEAATKVCSFLEDNGFSCWIAPRNIDPGANYPTQIVNAIKTCAAFVLLASESTNASGHVSNEVSIAFDNKKLIIPFKLQDFEFTDEYLYYLGRKHWIEAHADMNAGLLSLRSALAVFVSPVETPRPTPRPTPKPIPVAMPVPTPTSTPTSEPEVSRAYDRNSIVSLIISKSTKYAYNLYQRICDPATEGMVYEAAADIFSHIACCHKHHKPFVPETSYVDFIVHELSSGKNRCIQVRGLPGAGKNMLLQLAFYRMLSLFQSGSSDFLPFYVSAGYYEKIPYNPADIEGQMKSLFEKEFSEYFDYLSQNPSVKPVLFFEGIREHTVAQVCPESVLYSLWRPLGNFNRITAVDSGLIHNHSRLKLVIPITGNGLDYTISFSQIPLEDISEAKNLIRDILSIYEYEISVEEVYSALSKLRYTAVDIFLVRLIAHELISSYDTKEIRLIDMYKKLALSEFCGCEQQLFDISQKLFSYVFLPTYDPTTQVYDGAIWSLPHKHNSYLEFLISYYCINRILHFRETDDYSFFSIMFTSETNHFMVSFLKEDYHIQELLLAFVTENYEIFNIRQKSNALYLLGSISYSTLANQATVFLTREFTKLKPIIKSNNRFSSENIDNHFLFRAACTGLLFQGQANMLDEYLCVVVTNDVANALNRGTTIDYYGDSYQMNAYDTYSFDEDPSLGEQAIKLLSLKVHSMLGGASGSFVENSLITLLTLLQARIQTKHAPLTFDIIPYANKALEYLQLYQSKPQNVVSEKLLYYFQSVEEDLVAFLSNEKFDIGPIVYNKYRGLKDVKRMQWISRNIPDPESASEHSFSAWLMGLLFLPEEYNADGYCKKEILDMLLIHDMAEAELGDQTPRLIEPKTELGNQNRVLRKFFLKGTYPDIANLTYCYNIWTGFYNGLSINARTARDINVLQTVYTFCEYYCRYPEHFSLADKQAWLREKSDLKTELGHRLFERLITNNEDFAKVFNE